MVDDDILAVIQQVEFSVKFAHNVGGQAFAILCLLVYHQLKLCEHSLTIKRCAELLQEVVYEISAALLVGGYL